MKGFKHLGTAICKHGERERDSLPDLLKEGMFMEVKRDLNKQKEIVK